MSGNPQLGTNPFFSLDAISLDVSDATGPAATVMPFGTPFDISVTWELAGIFAVWFTSFPGIVYNVFYAFESLTNDPDDRSTNTGPLALTPGQLIYAAPNTTASITGGTLNVGVYQATAAVTFPTSPVPFPASAFFSPLLIEVF
jgi:hypothetical protein